jgi:glycerol-3-phosphate dehydrogenase
MEHYDLLVIGGGINGVGIARDAAGRGIKTLLVERGDFGGATSSASSKLIHGGLRYLEHGEFRLVRESLAEREVMLRIAPHLIRPLEFVLPHARELRPRWMIRAGLLLYDALAGRSSLPRSRAVQLAGNPYGAALKPTFTQGFVYSDAWVDDARLVILNARSAADKGAAMLSYTACTSAHRSGELWQVQLHDTLGNSERTVAARVIVNAAGPWIREVLEHVLHVDAPGKLRLVRGSHIVVPRLHRGAHAYVLQNVDKRVVFLIPYEHDYTAIGTTDVPVASMSNAPVISSDEIDYLCAAANRYVARPVTRADVRATWSGVRPLYDDGTADPAAITRDYHFVLNEQGPPLLSIYGGKLTTYRKLAEHALAKLARWLPRGTPWTADEPLPGGDFGGASFAQMLTQYCERYPQLSSDWLEALLRRHGATAAQILGDAMTLRDLGEDYGGGLCERELDHLIRNEWARTADDVLCRRTKAGLHMSESQRHRIAARLGA